MADTAFRRGSGLKRSIEEPDVQRTEFVGAGVNLRPANAIPAYRPIIGAMEAYPNGSDGSQSGDPAKAAAAMMEVVTAKNPPLLETGLKTDQ